MKEKLIIIKSYRGRPIVRTVESWDDEAVYASWSGGQIGFPREGCL